MTFTWNFTGTISVVTWGLANDAINDIDKTSGRLVSLDRRGVNVLKAGSVPVAYRGRVNGTRTGNSSSGQASFTLYNVVKDDERFYGCLLKSGDPNELDTSDLVQLAVVGMYVCIDLVIEGNNDI